MASFTKLIKYGLSFSKCILNNEIFINLKQINVLYK